MFSTRVIQKELNPVWEETAVVPLDTTSIRIGEKLSIQLWDSDRFSADDVLGQVDVDIMGENLSRVATSLLTLF